MGHWTGAGWRLFRRAPVRLFGVILAMLVLEGIIQAMVPGLGVFLSKWILAMAGGIIWLALANLEHTGKLCTRSRLWLDAVARSGRWCCWP
ncbi:MAG: hypothetical protein RQ741_09335 [Wenzhouxiangellaceae bacterium]|nr:hypothetical protein [Wenzhouxiangellaceae bacterium]